MRKSLFEKGIWNITFSLVTITISLFALIRSCIIENKLDETNYRIVSVEHRPRLKLSNTEITSFKVSVDSISSVDNNKFDSISNLYVDISFKIKVKVTNVGNSTAKISGWVITDTLSYREVIRKEVFGEVKKEKKVEVVKVDKPIFPHYLQELAPQESSFIEFNYNIQGFSEKGIIMHILIYYENELHQLFDTYYWTHFYRKKILLKSSDIIDGHSIDQKKLSKELFKIMEIKNENNDSEIYSEKQRKFIIQKFEN